eukprot:714238-Lingulodinium_polyedra.AAC.1
MAYFRFTYTHAPLNATRPGSPAGACSSTVDNNPWYLRNPSRSGACDLRDFWYWAMGQSNPGSF